MVELDHRRQVVQGLHPLRRRDGGEVVAQLGVGRAALVAGQPVVGVAPHDGVQVEAAGLQVAVQQAAVDQVAQGGVELVATSDFFREIGSLGLGRHRRQRLIPHRPAEAGDAAEQLLLGGQ